MTTKRTVVLVVEDEELIAKDIKYAAGRLAEPLQLKVVNNARDAMKVIRWNRKRLMGVLSDLWIFRDSKDSKPDPTSVTARPHALDVLDYMRVKNIHEVPIIVYTRFLWGEPTVGIVEQVRKQYKPFLLDVIRLEINTDKLAKKALRRFEKFHVYKK